MWCNNCVEWDFFYLHCTRGINLHLCATVWFYISIVLFIYVLCIFSTWLYSIFRKTWRFLCWVTVMHDFKVKNLSSWWELIYLGFAMGLVSYLEGWESFRNQLTRFKAFFLCFTQDISPEELFQLFSEQPLIISCCSLYVLYIFHQNRVCCTNTMSDSVKLRTVLFLPG